MIPDPVLARIQGARRVVEVGTGARFDVALALADALPGTTVVVTDVDAAVLTAPAPLEARVDDVLHPDPDLNADVDVIVMVRPPEELWVPAARLALRVGAKLLVRPLGNEVVDLAWLGARTEVLDGWLLTTFRR